MKRAGFCLALLLLSAAAATAQTPQQKPPSDDKELSDLMNILEQETDVATKTRLNSDYVPGIVTVLEGEQLEAMGVGTAAEALGMVPGMQAVFDNAGSPSVVVRGIDFPFNSGNIQILINSVPLTRADAGISASSLLLPIEQIERIEVIRGPGSVVYGDFAFMGLVNIVTRKEGQRLYGRGDIRRRSLGGMATGKSESMTWMANVSHEASGNAAVQLSRAHDDRTFGIVTLEGHGFSLLAQEVDRTFEPSGAGPHFGETSWVVDGRYGRDLAPKVHAEANVAYLKSDLDNTASNLQGDQSRFGLSFAVDRWQRQSWLVGADYSISSIDRATHVNPPPPGLPPGPPQTLAVGVDRRITGFVIQDRVDVTPKLSITLGARHDSYSDLQSRTTPRAAVVLRATDRHIFKAQYSEGFRPPTFFERYQPPAPGVHARYPFEVNATTELNYIYRSAGRVGRATVFRTVISDMLRPGGVTVPGEAHANGFELEWSQQVLPRLKVDANASHVTTRDPRSANLSDPIAAGWLANLGLYYQPLHNTVFGARLDHVGDRRGGSGYDLVDVTLSRRDLFSRGLGVRIGIKDFFDEHPTYLMSRPNAAPVASIFPGRSLWIQFSWNH